MGATTLTSEANLNKIIFQQASKQESTINYFLHHQNLSKDFYSGKSKEHAHPNCVSFEAMIRFFSKFSLYCKIFPDGQYGPQFQKCSACKIRHEHQVSE